MKRWLLAAGGLVWIWMLSSCAGGITSAAGTRERLHEEALAFYQAGRFDRALAAYRDLLVRDEHDLIARYNLACTLARTGQRDAALDELELAVKGGMSDKDRIEGDEDLVPLRASPRFADILALAGRVRAEQEARGRLLLPRGLRTTERIPLLVFLHGHLGRPEEVVQALSPLVDLQRVALLVPAGGQVFRKPCGMKVYAWLAQDLERVSDAVRALEARGPVDPARTFVAGFSGGAAMALQLGLSRPGLFRGVFALAGHLPPAWFRQLTRRDAPPARVPVVLLHGSADHSVPPSASRRAAQVLERAGYPVRLRFFPGGHHFPADLVSRLSRAMAWLRDNALPAGS